MSASDDFCLNNLLDELLIEVLRRLPTAKSVLAGCILVCKRWHSLIFSSYFVSQFEEHHRNQNKNSYYPAYQNPPWVFIRPMYDHKFFLVTDDTSILDSPGYTLEFLPEKRERVLVEASCNDLLLCNAGGVFRNCAAYYVCNPITRQWFRFPHPQANLNNIFLMKKIGLVYDLNYSQGKKYERRFRVVCITKDDSMHIYSSETKHWNEFPPLVEEYRPCYLGNVVALGGRLHWCNARVDHVVAYDPFSKEAILIDCSDEDKRNGLDIPCLGICQGTLRLIKLKGSYVSTINGDSIAVSYLSVWDLMDDRSKRMTLKHKIFIDNRFTKPLGSHPTDKDVVFMKFGDAVVSCKIQGEALEVVGYKDHYARENSLIFHFRSELAFTAMLPWWPTPISNDNVSNPLSSL